MKIIKTFKYAGLVALVLGVAIGCAGTPTQEQAGEQVQGVTAAEAQAAIDQAKAALSKAQAAGAAWRDTDGIIKQAEELQQKGDYEGAKRMADMARTQAENALEQKKREEARLAAQMQTEMPSKMDQYVVKPGDSLWQISGMDEVYGNPYEWPLIYKTNQDKIRDADLIYPGQQFAIDRNASAADIDAAVRHAKTRGAWSVGVTEESDRAYLAK